MRQRVGTLRHLVKPTQLRTVERRKLVHGDAMAECKPIVAAAPRVHRKTRDAVSGIKLPARAARLIRLTFKIVFRKSQILGLPHRR
jgi:hypothetical protein